MTVKKYIVVVWLAGVTLPSIVAVISWIGRSVVETFALPGVLIYLELIVGIGLCVFALLFSDLGWISKLFGLLVSCVLLLLQVLVLGILVFKSGRLEGILS